MQVWLDSGDPILVTEAQQFFTAQAQKESVSLASTGVVAPKQPEACLSEEAVMPVGLDDRNRNAEVVRLPCKKFSN
jgi:hypothetical protein